MLTCAFFVLTSAAFAQQQTAPSDPYQGQSNPPADDVIVTTQPDQPKPKPRAGKPLVQPPVQQQVQAAPQPQSPDNSAAPDAATLRPTSVDPRVNFHDADVNGTDDGIVGIAKPEPQAQDQGPAGPAPGLTARGSGGDPDGDIVNPHPLAPGQLPDGTTIRVHLLTRLSSVESRQGEVFRTRVASDVLQDGQVLIPTGAEIDGRVMQVIAGTSRSHGAMLLRPDTVILLDGARYRLDAQVTGTPGANAHVTGEGFIDPGSRRRKDSLEYGGAVGGGVVVGALVAGPVGAITGGVIGAGAVTVRILTNHSEATLEPGTVMLFTLDNRLDLQAANPTGN
jgi:hypothetical protein